VKRFSVCSAIINEIVVGSLFSHARSLPDIADRDEARELWPDARPQARKNRRRIRWNMLGFFRAEHDADDRGSFAAVERSMSDRLLASHHDGQSIFPLGTQFFAPAISPRLPSLI